MGKRAGIVTRNLMTGKIEIAHRRRGGAGHGRVRQRLLSVDQRQRVSNATAIWRAHKRGALFANPCFTQIHPTCIPVSGDYQSKLTLMSESLRNDGRVWVPAQEGRQARPPAQIPEAERDYFLERKYPSFGNLVPRDVASRNAKQVCDEGRGVGETGLAVYPGLPRFHSSGWANRVIKERYGNLFDMYERITGERSVQRCRCASTRPSTTPWAACGWTTT